MISPKSLVPIVSLALAISATTTIAAPGDRRFDNRQQQDHQRGGQRTKVARIFHALDVDGNGIITLDEFLAKSIAKAADQFARIDTNDDELISLEEFLLVHGDQGNNADIDVEALRACIAENSDVALPERLGGEARFDEIDTNDDDFIDLDEFIAAKTSYATGKFNQIDTDADGAITPEELFSVFKAHREHRAIRRACVEEQRDVDALLGG